MRLLGALTRLERALRALFVATLLVAGSVGSALGAEPTATSAPGTPRTPSCSDRYPEEGPAGVDLRLGCLIGEVVGQYTASATGRATPASSYALVLLGFIVAAFLAFWFVVRVVRRGAGRRLAPVQPTEWWLCATCRSVNGVRVEHCYACGSARPALDALGPTLRTDDEPSASQSFGSTRKRG